MSSSAEHINTHSNHYRRLFFFLNLVAVLSILSILPGGAQALPQAPVGYGPGFDACGDNCQTQLLHFCTQGRDAQQQSDCWCGEDTAVEGQFVEKMNACLASCDPQVTDTAVQQNQILRYKSVVCKGSTAEDEDFQKYYSTRYEGNFVPQATQAAPPPPDYAVKPTTIDTIDLTPTTATATRAPQSTTTRRPRTTTEEEKETAAPTSTRSTRTRDAEVTSTSSPEETSTAGNSETTSQVEPAPTSTSPETRTTDSAFLPPAPTENSDSEGLESPKPRRQLSNSQLAGVVVGSVMGFVLCALCGLIMFRYCRGRRDTENDWYIPEDKRISSSSHGGFSPISPMARQMRDTPDGFSPDYSRGQRFKRALAAFIAWRPEPGRFDIEDQLPYNQRSGNTPDGPAPPAIRVSPPPKLSISPPMMMAGTTGISPAEYRHHSAEMHPHHASTLRAITPSPEPQHPSVVPTRKDVILPPIPVVPQTPATPDFEAHAITTPSGYVDPYYTYIAGPSQPRPRSEATEMDIDSSECSSEYSNSEWTDYDEGSFNRSASQAAIDALVQEVDRRNQRLRQGSR